MELFSQIVLVSAAVFLVFCGSFMTTKNLQSTIIFNVIPFILAVCLAVLALKEFGFLIQIG